MAFGSLALLLMGFCFHLQTKGFLRDGKARGMRRPKSLSFQAVSNSEVKKRTDVAHQMAGKLHFACLSAGLLFSSILVSPAAFVSAGCVFNLQSQDFC